MTDAELANEMRKNLERELRQGIARGVQAAAAYLVEECRKTASKDQPKYPLGRDSRYGSPMYHQKENASPGAPMRRLSGDNVKEYEYEMGGEMYAQILGMPGKKIQARVGTNVLSTPPGYYKRKHKSPYKREKGDFPYSAYHEGDKSLGTGAGNHPVIDPTVERELENIGNLIVSKMG